ncbi:ABC transporter permease [Streptomyces sp. NPDC020875]|uniref:ABC transporter permease n=1 Tax=Streptomyces sp. NPDC020875 TaxID=3154898 RepID=UPI003411534A
MLPVWVLVLSMIVVSGAGTIEGLYATPSDRAEFADSMSTNGSLRALYGTVFGDSVGALVAWRFGVSTAVLAAVMSLLIVIRHTREEEETGRQEMIASGVVGRRAGLTAALLTAFVANAAVAVLVAAGLAGSTGDPAGGVALGLGIAGVGLLFAGVAAIAAQFTESARLARGLTGAALGLAFGLRAAGDAGDAHGDAVLTWLSPLGWAGHLRPYAGERWWILLLFAAAVIGQGALAFVLAGRRDVGMSFLPTRPGPAEGRLGTVAALAWRLQRGALYGWTAGFLVAGFVFGGMADGAADLVGENESTREIFERMGGQSGLTEAFLAAIAGLFAMLAAVYVVGSVLRLHGEEAGQRAEPLLATAVSRTAWAASHLTIAFGGAVVVVTAAGLGLAVGHGKDFGAVLGAALVLLPAVWLLGGLAVLVHGFFPRYAPAAWAVVGTALAIGWLGPALDLPAAVLDLSPFSHLPKMPGEAMNWPPVLVLTALAAGLVAAGLAGLRRRDILTG